MTSTLSFASCCYTRLDKSNSSNMGGFCVDQPPKGSSIPPGAAAAAVPLQQQEEAMCVGVAKHPPSLFKNSSHSSVHYRFIPYTTFFHSS